MLTVLICKSQYNSISEASGYGIQLLVRARNLGIFSRSPWVILLNGYHRHPPGGNIGRNAKLTTNFNMVSRLLMFLFYSNIFLWCGIWTQRLQFNYQNKIFRTTTFLSLHGVEPWFRSWWSQSYSKDTSIFAEPERLLPCSQNLPSQVLILRQTNPVHNLPVCILKITFNIILWVISLLP